MKPTQLANEEANKIKKNIPKFQPYRQISNIFEIGSICSMYGRIQNGHRKEAKSYFDKLPTWSRSKLPQWVIDYFITDTDFMSYDHWKLFGRQVKLGEKSIKRDNAGTALFQKTQTRVIGEKFVEQKKVKGKTTYKLHEPVIHINDPKVSVQKLRKVVEEYEGNTYPGFYGIYGFTGDDMYCDVDDVDWGYHGQD